MFHPRVSSLYTYHSYRDMRITHSYLPDISAVNLIPTLIRDYIQFALRWVVGPWSECSHWCGLGVQRRLVACGLPLVAGATPLVAGRFLTQGRCAGDQPTEVRLCKGLCVEGKTKRGARPA